MPAPDIIPTNWHDGGVNMAYIGYADQINHP
jgi:hypothetical protein